MMRDELAELLDEIDEMSDLLRTHSGGFGESESAKLAAIRSRIVSLLAAQVIECKIQQLRQELFSLIHNSKRLQFASLAMSYSTAGKGAQGALDSYACIADVRPLSDAERRDRAALIFALDEAKQGYDNALDELQNVI